MLRLFVAGTTTRSHNAITNVRRICDYHLAGRFDLEVIDVYTHPEDTREFQIVATPTLVKVAPPPLRRIVGDLSNLDRVLDGLSLGSSGGNAKASS
ncbi:circadian clock KaiB family protein [Beijerinckia sp. L45]|uniref:circadian clock KaiB family protein n=1 Tax=Beijerinckia sp. L45 TaxID=1641855 RepID=UPI001FEE89F3|nr:circadian clock KaiB family protein [Beijerinckia sp. L45]